MSEKPEINTVICWLEGLAEDNWADFYSDSEVQNVAKAALELLEEPEEPVAPRTEGRPLTWWYVCGACNADISPNDKYCSQCGRSIKWKQEN